MFDISFIELLVIAIVALVVLGPDKLPDAIRTSALWLGRAKRSFNKAKMEIEQQLNTDEIRRQLHNESILSDIEEARRKADALVKDAQQELDSGRESIKEVVDSARDIPAITNSAQEGLPTGLAGSHVTPIAHDDEPGAIEAVEAVETAASNENSGSTVGTESTGDAADPDGTPTAATTAAEQPLHDFYNSPPQGRVRLDGGKYYAVDEPAPVDDQAVSDDQAASDDQPASDEKAAPSEQELATSDKTPTKRSADEH